PPFSRVRVAARAESASLSSPLSFEIFAVRRDGTPDDRATVDVDSAEGEAELHKHAGHGVYLARFTPSAKSGTARIIVKANVEALLEGGASWFGQLTQAGATPGTTDTARPQTKFIQAGARIGKQLVRNVDGHATVVFGASHQSVSRTIGATNAQVSSDAWTPH